jgi:CheY-like chemotaxis protein
MTEAMTQVVVVEFDEASRAMLHDILALDGHYPVIAFSDEMAALAYLTAAPERVIAVVSNQDVHHQRSAAFFAAVAADEQLVTRHQYLMLSTNPREMPAGLQANLTYLQATILTKPFELDTLLAAVREEAARLATLPLPLAPAARRPLHRLMVSLLCGVSWRGRKPV